MALKLALRGGDELVGRPNDGAWEIVRGLDRVAELTVSTEQGSRVTMAGDGRTWSVTGAMVPLGLTLWDEAAGEGAAWCNGHTIGLDAVVQVAGAEQDLKFHTGLIGGARLTADDGLVAAISAKGRDTKLVVRLEIADHPDLESFAGGLVLVAVWRTFAGMMPFTGNSGPVGP